MGRSDNMRDGVRKEGAEGGRGGGRKYGTE